MRVVEVTMRKRSTPALGQAVDDDWSGRVDQEEVDDAAGGEVQMTENGGEAVVDEDEAERGAGG